MSELSRTFKAFFKSAERNEEAKILLKERNQVFQFDLEGGKPFYVEIKDGKISVTDGTSPLDWKRKDWQQISCIWTDPETIAAVIKGKTGPVKAGLEGRWSFSSRVGKKATHRWFCNLLRLSLEQVRHDGAELYLQNTGG